MRLRYPAMLLALYLVVFAWSAYRPMHLDGWILENLLVAIFVPLLIWSYWRFRLSNISYTLIFIFMVLHTVGSHYTYAEVPFGFWMQEVFGFSRNHYDRIVHFSFGLLFAYPVREVFLRIAATKGIWGYWLPVELTFAFSAIFEIFEWIVTLFTPPEAGNGYLGMQGDMWDAQKDMALAGIGALIAMTTTLIINWKLNPLFHKHMARSLEIKGRHPLGERMLNHWKGLKKKKR